MIDVIGKVKEIIGNGLIRLAAKNGISATENQIVIFTDDAENCFPKYQYLINQEFKKDLKFSEILGDVDWMGLGGYAKKYIAIRLKSFSDEYKCAPSAIKGIVFFDKKDGKTLRLNLKINGELKKELYAEDLIPTEVNA